MKNLILGQRYMSLAEPELGLGVIIEIEEKTIQLAYPASEESRRYGIKTAPIKRVLFETGDEVSSNENHKFIVQKILTDDEGLLVYLGASAGEIISECDLLDSINFHKPEEKLLNLSTDSQELFNLRYETIKAKTWLTSNPYFGLLGGRISLIHHQLYLAQEISKRIHPRVLLADEVGLGKTIEAGLIIHKLLTTKRIERVLIVLPNALCYQWFLEMYRKYNLSFSVVVDEDDMLEHDNIFDENNLIITSMQLLCESDNVKNQIQNSHFDMLVVDEAHRMEYCDGIASTEYKNIELLSKRIKSLLLLTATPEMFGLEGHFARLKLIDPEHFYSYEKFIKDNEQLTAMAALGKKLIEQSTLTPQDITALDQLGIDEEDNKNRLNALIDRHGTGRVYFRNTRKVMSKTYNFFPKRHVHTYPLEDCTSNDSYNLKLLWLIDFLKENNENKVLLICRSKEVILNLEKDLLEMSVKNKIALFHSDLSLLARDRQAAYFADSNGANILLCSEIGSEGRNFEFANQLILFDLPKAPDLLEQRIGRLDRIGQKRDIHLHVPYQKKTWEEILFNFYAHALNAFEKTINGAGILMQKHEQELYQSFDEAEKYLENDHKLLNKFITKCSSSYQEIGTKLEFGRDILIELNSFRNEQAQTIVNGIDELDNQHKLQNYLEKVFSNFGVEIEDLGEQCFFIKPGDNMYISSFPNLPADGFSYTCSRKKALEKEDITFMSWDHPLVQSVIELIVGNEYGNATVTTRKKAGKPRPYLEMYFVLSTVAPKDLEIDRFLPPSSIRVLLNLEAENFTEKFTKEKLDTVLIDASTEIRVLISKIGKPRLKELFKHAHDQAVEKSKEITSKAKIQVQEVLSFEIVRLKKLQKVNPIDSSKDIEILETRKTALTSYVDKAEVHMDSFRFIY
jgi:ATP-dependent helicase HepA